MSVFSDKRVFGIKRNNVSGIVTAGQVSANDIILWTVFLLPVNIALFGAGQCLVAIGIFVGNVFAWLFLSKRMNAYTELSSKKIHNAPELFEARYNSSGLKNITSIIWIIALGMILVSVLRTLVKITSDFMDADRFICLLIIVVIMAFATILLDNRTIGFFKTIIFAFLIFASVGTIIYIFSEYSASEILDLYRISGTPTDTSKYLNILYYKGAYVEISDVITMLSVGIGCIGMPLMYKGVINVRDIKGLDSSRIWAVIFSGLTLISTCMLSLLIIPMIHPTVLSSKRNFFEAYNLLYKALFKGNEYADSIRLFVLCIYILAIIILMESLMRNICEHVRGLIPSVKKNIPVTVKLIIDIVSIISVGIIVLIVVYFVDFDEKKLIVTGWGICAGTLAAPCIMALMWKNSTKNGILRGIEMGLLVYLVWECVPIINNMTMHAATNVRADLIAFVFSLATIIIVSMFTKKTDKDERIIFERMRQNQI